MPEPTRREHGSEDSHGQLEPLDETAATEVDLFFRPEELVSYERATDRWILE